MFIVVVFVLFVCLFLIHNSKIFWRSTYLQGLRQSNYVLIIIFTMMIIIFLISHYVYQLNIILHHSVVTVRKTVLLGCLLKNIIGPRMKRGQGEHLIKRVAKLTYNSRFQINKHSPWYVLPWASFAEECIEGIVPSSNGLITRHLTIRLDTMFQAIQLPACIANLHTGLTNVDRDTFTLQNIRKRLERIFNACSTLVILNLKFIFLSARKN